MFRKIIFFEIALLITLSLASQQKIRIEINSLPVNDPANSSIFIAGSFNSWNPQNKDFQFQKNEKAITQTRKMGEFAYFAFALYSLCAIMAIWFPLPIAIITTLTWVFWLIWGIRVKHE